MSSKQPQSYRELISWQKGMLLAKLIYRLTAGFPNEEKFGLISQMRRAAVSVPSNLAEGQARRTTGEFVQFISHAEGSVAELDTQLILSVELGFCSALESDEVSRLIQELRKMLNALRLSVTDNS
ncbi:MAG: four helix bundle protein [Verrucomicrobiales bacterium]|nr:four helix bundle protein [Verrucomicrobiales bacterium]